MFAALCPITRLAPPPLPPAIGLTWNKTSDTYTRLGMTAGKARSFFDTQYPWAGMRRCNLSDAGQVLAYYGDPGYREDGSGGQVMVETPRFYYRPGLSASDLYPYTSSYPRPGYKVHPMFVRNGVVQDHVYIGAYEACCEDVSAGAYNLTDAAGIDFTASTGDKLASIAGAKPISGLHNTLTIVNARKLAQNRGPNWQLTDFLSMSGIQLLYLMEYANFNTQSTIGQGVVGITDDGSTNMAVNTGQTASLGNASGSATGQTHYQTGQAANSVSYRGLENLWGNIWTWIDGINIQADHRPWVADHGFASDKFSAPYVDTGLVLLGANGYVSDIALSAAMDYGFLPSAVTGTSSTKLCDYYYQAAGNMAALLGGNWTYGSSAGAFAWNVRASSSYAGRDVGARLLYVGGSS